MAFSNNHTCKTTCNVTLSDKLMLRQTIRYVVIDIT